MTSSKLKCLVLNSCSKLDRGTLSQCRIAGALEGTQFRLGVRRLLVQLPTTMNKGGASSWFYRKHAVLEICTQLFVMMCLVHWLPSDHHYLA